jgi:hypothetical protein
MEPQASPLYSAAGGDEDVYGERDEKLWAAGMPKILLQFF